MAKFYIDPNFEIPYGDDDNLSYTEIDVDDDHPNGPFPPNNDGRETCAWCGAPTREVPGFNVTDIYNICVECER